MTVGNFWDYNVWSFILLLSMVLASLLIANLLRKLIKPLEKSLIPVSVIAGILLLIISSIYKAFSGVSLFDIEIFDPNGELAGTRALEVITYHCLGIGFVAMALRTSNKVKSKERNKDIFNSGVITVSSYLIQGIIGLAISIIFALCGSKLTFKAAGILLPFGYGQGTGQALNYGNIYETTYSFVGGKSFGLTIAALGFLSAAIGGVIYLNILKKKGKIVIKEKKNENLAIEDF